MLTSESKNRINACRDILVGKLPLPTVMLTSLAVGQIFSSRAAGADSSLARSRLAVGQIFSSRAETRWMTWKSIWLFQALKITSMRQRRP
jgi:hypothetical protein